MSENLSNNKRSKSANIYRKKLRFMMGIFLTFLILVGVLRVSFIKQRYGNEYEVYAIENQINKIQDTVINPNRGSILDRNNQALAISNVVYNVILDIRIITSLKEEEQAEIVANLSEILEMNSNEITKYLAKDELGNLVYDTNWKIIKKKISYETGKIIEGKKLKGVYLEKDTLRSYPYNNLAAQVIGFIRGDTSWGIESKYNEEMTGTAGRIYRTYEGDNSVETTETDPIKGNTIITTLDLTIQQFAEDIVKKTYENAKPDHTAESVSMIVMNPKTAEIIAMAEYPNFNLNEPSEITLLNDSIYKDIINEMSEEQIMSLTNKVWKNFATTETFEPGSTFKPILIATALEENIITKEDTFYCSGSKVFGSDTIRCHKRSGHGTQTIDQALANSCNVAMMDVASKMGREIFYKYQKDFGFGEKTGIDLPGEVDASNLLYSLERLNTVELATSSFGQGFNSTAIQILNAFAATINGGNLMRPYVVSQIMDENNEIIKENLPEVVRKVISEETSDYIRNILQKVISTEGTGKNAIIEGYNIGGKTGTAQQGKRTENMYTLSFIAYLPVENPEYIAMSVIHYPKNYSDGVISPVPMVKELFQNIINYKSIQPSDDSVEVSQEVSVNTDVWIDDYTEKSLKETVKELNRLGIEFQISGGGDTVIKTFPAGNTKIPKNSKIILYVANSKGNGDLLAVPDVTWMSLEEAEKILLDTGFEVSVEEISKDNQGEAEAEKPKVDSDAEIEMKSETIPGDEEDSFNTVKKQVIAQIPEPLVHIEKGTIIKLKVE